MRFLRDHNARFLPGSLDKRIDPSVDVLPEAYRVHLHALRSPHWPSVPRSGHRPRIRLIHGRRAEKASLTFGAFWHPLEQMSDVEESRDAERKLMKSRKSKTSKKTSQWPLAKGFMGYFRCLTLRSVPD